MLAELETCLTAPDKVGSIFVRYVSVASVFLYVVCVLVNRSVLLKTSVMASRIG